MSRLTLVLHKDAPSCNIKVDLDNVAGVTNVLHRDDGCSAILFLKTNDYEWLSTNGNRDSQDKLIPSKIYKDEDVPEEEHDKYPHVAYVNQEVGAIKMLLHLYECGLIREIAPQIIDVNKIID